MRETKWMLFECGAGRRWSSTTENYAGEPCAFSGCDCGSIVRKVGTTTSRDEAGAHWDSGTQCGTTHAVRQ